MEDNSTFKSNYLLQRFSVDCFADDTGLEISALDNEPGVYSARYAGEPANSDNNIELVLSRLQGVENRSARFRTVITLILNSHQFQFEGTVQGEITSMRIGSSGFGYDPIFRPSGFQQTFAEMTLTQKNEISHRAIAVKKMVDFLNKSN